ncbi:MAG: aminotransferase [Gemmatimonadetes bacterium]|nr:MAG: aminotransferase [Gemmatimonadota bacterium]PYO83440.1 MAG: aminotransferase [Gemmatimonadota bacterium]PYP65065.1 MAG: aminotransferase [Gemmatimonadota bacterium]
MIVFFNGTFIDKAQATVSVDDRGFLFGDGVYEVFRATEGELFAADRHLRRLARGLAVLELARPAALTDAALLAAARRVLDDNALTRGDALVYLQITRGAAGPRAHQFPPAGTPPTVYLAANAFTPPDDVRARGASVVTTPDERWGRCDIKSIQLLPNVLAKQRAVRADAFEAVFVRDGRITEGASANLFAVLGGTLRTHPADHHILPGITREILLEEAEQLGVAVVETAVTPKDLANAEEVFVTSTSADVMPVVRVDGRPVGGGQPGPVAQRLHTALRALRTRPAPAAALRSP